MQGLGRMMGVHRRYSFGGVTCSQERSARVRLRIDGKPIARLATADHPQRLWRSQNMRKRLLAVTLAGLAAVSMVSAATVQAQPASSTPSQCFYPNNWNGWKATPDSKSIYIRVGVSDIYRLDLSAACPELQEPNAHLINDVRGPSQICSAVDLDLKVSDGHGFSTGCIVSSITPLSRAQAAALPRNLRP
jgi:hypothetical protein